MHVFFYNVPSFLLEPFLIVTTRYANFLICEFEMLNFSSFNSSMFHFLFCFETLQLTLFLSWVQRWNDCCQILKADLLRRVKLTVVSHGFFLALIFYTFFMILFFLFDLLSWRLRGRLDNLEEISLRLFSRGLSGCQIPSKAQRKHEF